MIKLKKKISPIEKWVGMNGLNLGGIVAGAILYPVIKSALKKIVPSNVLSRLDSVPIVGDGILPFAFGVAFYRFAGGREIFDDETGEAVNERPYFAAIGKGIAVASVVSMGAGAAGKYIPPTVASTPALSGPDFGYDEDFS